MFVNSECKPGFQAPNALQPKDLLYMHTELKAWKDEIDRLDCLA